MKHSVSTLALGAIWAVLISACTVTLPVEPRPRQDLVPTDGGALLGFDLTEHAGIPVTVNGRVLNLLLLPREASVLAINADIAEELDLRPVMFGLGSTAVRDGDYRVTGEVVSATYSIGVGDMERGWALVMEEDIHPDYDGAISFGAIPATRFRLQINPDTADTATEWQEMTLTGRTEESEQERNYRALDFSHRLSLFQDEVTTNRKASFYLNLAGRLEPSGEPTDFTRLFNNTRPHRPYTIDPPLNLALGPIDSVLAEVEDTGLAPGRAVSSVDDRVSVVFDERGVAHGPMVRLGRSYFAHCYEIEVDKARLSESEQILRVRCSSEPHSAAH